MTWQKEMSTQTTILAVAILHVGRIVPANLMRRAVRKYAGENRLESSRPCQSTKFDLLISPQCSFIHSVHLFGLLLGVQAAANTDLGAVIAPRATAAHVIVLVSPLHGNAIQMFVGDAGSG